MNCWQFLMMWVEIAVTVRSMMTGTSITVIPIASVTIPITAIVLFAIDSWMMCMSNFLNNGIETIVIIGCVLNQTSCAVRFLKFVSTFEFELLIDEAIWIWLISRISYTFNNSAMTTFPLFFVVSGMCIFYSIFEFIIWLMLCVKLYINYKCETIWKLSSNYTW